MSIEDSVRLLEWLQNIFPRQYSAKMSDARRDDLLDLLEASFGGYKYEEVREAYKEILKTYDGGAPEIAMVRNRLQTMHLVRENAEKMSEDRSRDNVDGLPEFHPWRGCYSHEEAYNAHMKDIIEGKAKGKQFADYVAKYPSVKWRPWANRSLNRDRWPYITADNFGGWTTDKDGFCVPYTKQEER